MYIYKTTNTVNGMIYIGQTLRKNHKNYVGSGKVLSSEIKKVGVEYFNKEILEYCNSVEELNDREIYWISYYNSTNPLIGYNLSGGGGQIGEFVKAGCNTDVELIRKSIASKKLWESAEYRRRVTESNIKYWSDKINSTEHSIKMSKIFKTDVYKKKLSSSLLNMEILECPHCNRRIAKNHATSKHFDNCTEHTDPEKRKIAIEKRNLINIKTKKIQCPHCDKIGTVGNMNRWHFDNCRNK